MLDKLRDQMAAYLSQHQVCVLSTAGAACPELVKGGDWAMPVRYRSRGLDVDCLVPRWANAAYHLEQDSRVLLIIQACYAAGLRWLQIQGTARPVAAPDWARLLPRWMSTALADDLYLVIRVTPERIELFDESRGWGVRETLEL